MYYLNHFAIHLTHNTVSHIYFKLKKKWLPRRKPSLALLSTLAPKSDSPPPFALPLKRGDRLSFIRWFTQFTYFSQQGHFYSVSLVWKAQMKVLKGKQNRQKVILLSWGTKRKEWGTDISWACFVAAFCCFGLILRVSLENQRGQRHAANNTMPMSGLRISLPPKLAFITILL